MDEDRTQKPIDLEAYESMPPERKRMLMTFRALLEPILTDLAVLLHVSQPLEGDEALDIEINTDCGFTGVLRIHIRNSGDCEDIPTDERLRMMAEMVSKEGKIVAPVEVHPVQKKGLQEVMDDLMSMTSRKTEDGAGAEDIEGIESLLNDVLQKRKGRPKKGDSPKTPTESMWNPKDMGFLE